MTDDQLRVRAPVVRVLDHGDATTVIGAAFARRFDGTSAELVRAVLEIHARPVTRGQLLAAIAERAGGEPTAASTADATAATTAAPAAAIDQLLALLTGDGVLIPAPTLAPPPPAAARRRVVLAVTGAVAAADAPALVRGLHALGCDVRVALSRSARRFVAPDALDALTHHQVWTGLWQRSAAAPVPHINLAAWAELVVVCPASATSIARIAHGECSDLVAAIATATRAPVLIVPSMNDAMYESPAVQHNLATLRAHGRWLVHPALGVEVADRPEARRPVLGSAPPPAAVLDLVHHALSELIPTGAADSTRVSSID